jgi:ABC-type phosphate/phosphonate transport system substrate-binding protein
MRAVREGKADVCAIDAVSAALSRRYRPSDVEGLVEVARSPRVPGLPYVTSRSCSEAELTRLRRVFDAAFKDEDLADARRALFLAGYTILDDRAYERIVELESAVEAAGGLKLL